MPIIQTQLKGKTPVIESLNVTPSTSAQQITVPTGTDGYSPVNVSAVTSSIDANITAGNIKDGVTILGVTGNYQGGGSNVLVNQYRTDSNGRIIQPNTVMDLGSATDIGDYGLKAIYMGNNYITTVTLNQLTEVSGDGAFYLAFDSCGYLTSFTADSIVTISGAESFNNAFYGCYSLSSVSFAGLEEISGDSSFSVAFGSNTALSSITFPSLKEISGVEVFAQAFSEGSVYEVYFPALSENLGSENDQFVDMFYESSVNCHVHFPSNLQAIIGNWVCIQDLGASVLYDLPSTTPIDGDNGVTYERNPRYDTVSALAWRVNGTHSTSTTYYTSGTTDPTIGDIIYSDSACTTSVTIISSIA